MRERVYGHNFEVGRKGLERSQLDSAGHDDNENAVMHAVLVCFLAL